MKHHKITDYEGHYEVAPLIREQIPVTKATRNIYYLPRLSPGETPLRKARTFAARRTCNEYAAKSAGTVEIANRIVRKSTPR